MNSFVKFWLDPFNILWFSFLLGTTAYFLKKFKLSVYIFGFTGLWLLITSNFLLPNFLISKLEKQFIPFSRNELSVDSSVYNIVVLGAGFSDNNLYPYNDQLFSTALSRLIEGIRIHYLLPKSKLIVSGPGFNGGISQAEVYLRTASSLGFDSTEIFKITSATNTFEEAKYYAEIFGKTATVILVTSASHMPRAMMMFKLQGITPVSAPIDFKVKPGEKESNSWMPSSENMNKMKLAMIEYVGILYVKWFLF